MGAQASMTVAITAPMGLVPGRPALTASMIPTDLEVALAESTVTSMPRTVREVAATAPTPCASLVLVAARTRPGATVSPAWIGLIHKCTRRFEMVLAICRQHLIVESRHGIPLCIRRHTGLWCPTRRRWRRRRICTPLCLTRLPLYGARNTNAVITLFRMLHDQRPMLHDQRPLSTLQAIP